VASIAVAGSIVYASGGFTSVGGQPRRYLAAINAATGAPTAWDPSPDDYVEELLVSGSTVYAGGLFTSIGGANRRSLAALDATTGAATAWDARLNDYYVNALALSGSTLYVGGGFSAAGGKSRRGLAALDAVTGDATAWNPNPGGRVYALGLSGTHVVVGGVIAGAGAPLATIRGLARVLADGTLDTSWHPDPAITGVAVGVGIQAVTLSGSALYATGHFSSIGGQSRGGLAAVDTTTGAVRAWNPGVSGFPSALAVSGGLVYLGGSFASVGGQARAGLASVDATTGAVSAWNPGVGGGGGVNTLAVQGTTVYAGGNFTSVGGTGRNGLAAIDAASGAVSAWNPNPALGQFYGMRALALANGVVYAAGNYTAIGGQARSGVAALDPATGDATAFNPGVGQFAGLVGLSLAATDSTVFAGGVSGIASIDAMTGTASILIRTSNGSSVNALAASDTALYAGGNFRSVGGLTTGPFARIERGASSDTAAPTITIHAPAEGQHFALGATVSAAYSCDDGTGSGVATCTGLPTVDTSIPGARTYTVQATDVAGNATSNTAHYVIDAPAAADQTLPTIAIVTPAAGVSFTLRESVASQFFCDDGSGSGVATCAGPSVVDTTTEGEHAFTVTATDKAGNSSSQAVRYLVLAPTTGGTPGPDDGGSGGSGGAAGGSPAGGTTAGGTTGSGSAGSSTAQIAAALQRQIVPSGKAATIAKLRSRGSFALQFTALQAGKAELRWYQTKAGGKRVLVASATAAFGAPGAKTLIVKLTAAGNGLLKSAKRLSLKAEGTFTPTGKAPVKTTKAFVLKR
jgi:hypothetical protein